jgi:SAM-dependent methyltransferase
MTGQDADQIRTAVREHYGKAATHAASCCGGAVETSEVFGAALYDIGERTQLPQAALDASMGCGNPTALADLAPGDVVLDLGSGGGIDVLLAARRVGPTGMAYGLDLTPQMHALAQRNRAAAGVENAEFLVGGIEDIPLPDGCVDVVISNCVLNLSADKPAAIGEAFRVLRPGGRLAVSDMLLRRPLPPEVTALMGLWTGCVAGALLEQDFAAELAAAGFTEIGIEPAHVYTRAELAAMAAGCEPPAAAAAGPDAEATLDALDGAVMSAFVRAVKPLRAPRPGAGLR